MDKYAGSPKFILLSKDREFSPRTGTPPPTSKNDSTRNVEDRDTQSSVSSQAVTRGTAQGQDSPRLDDKQGRRSSRHSLGEENASREDVGGSRADGDDSGAPLPTLPQVPTNCVSREEIVNEVLDLTGQDASVALFGSMGIGKTSVALTLLHHERTRVKFGRNRHFMRCDNLPNSLEGFLECLSDAIHTDRTTNIAQLRSHLESSPPLILLLDGVDLILDPLSPQADEISAAIEEFGSYEHVCLVTTSRMYPDIHGFHRVEVPTLSEDAARDAFYSLSNLGRSSAVNDLIVRLDFHPLSINLLASFVRENGWDEPMLLKAWDNDQASALEESYHQSLKDAVELVFRSPTIQNLGTTARDALVAIAALPRGVEECRLGEDILRVAGIGEVVDVLCKFSLVYRQDGFVKMFSPFRLYFVGSALRPMKCAETVRSDDVCYPSRARVSFSLHLFFIIAW